MSYVVQRTRVRVWPLRQYVALGPGMRIVAFGQSRGQAKERAVAKGFATPLVVPAARVRTGEYARQSMTMKFNNPEEAEALDTLRTYHTPKLDEFRALLPEVETSNLIQHMINPMAIMVQLTGYDPSTQQGFALVQPTPEKLQEIQITIGAALLAICEELDERIPPRKATIVTTPTKSG